MIGPMRLTWLLLALVSIASADSISVSGACATTQCTNQITDQYGDPWAYAATNIIETAGAVSGQIQTSLGLTGYDQYLHPDANGAGPDVGVSITIDLPEVSGTYDVYISSLGQSDECGGCAPSLQMSGLSDGVYVPISGQYSVGPTTEYINVPGLTDFTISSNVSTIIQDSSDTLDFAVWWVDPPTSVPEPSAYGLAGLGLFLIASRVGTSIRLSSTLS